MLITHDELLTVFQEKYGDLAKSGPLPRRYRRYGYILPDEYYETVVERLVTPRCRWLDVGGGREIFPDNPRLARRLAERCDRLVAVDPSPNVIEHPLAHERVCSSIEEYRTDESFDVLTMRMVAEHVTQPHEAVSSMARLLKPGGRLVVYTVNKFAMVSIAAWAVPFWLHHPIKRLVWQTEEKDTFPVVYRMNTRRSLRRIAEAHGLKEEGFYYLDDCRTSHRFNWLNHLELIVWRTLRRVSVRYPETCLLGVYQREGAISSSSTVVGTHRPECASEVRC